MVFANSQHGFDLIDGAEIKIPWYRQLFQRGWRATIAAGSIVLFVSLIINTTFLVWAYLKPAIPNAPPVTDGIVLFDGDCDKANVIKVWTHLSINVVSTIVLMTSASCMQCLASPARGDIDRAHSRGYWMDVGVLSFNNLKRISLPRAFCFLMLALATLPLHLLYNSVVFSTLSANDVVSVLMTDKHWTIGDLNETRFQEIWSRRADPNNSWYIYDDAAYAGVKPTPQNTLNRTTSQYTIPITTLANTISDLFQQAQESRLQNLTVEDCRSAYSNGMVTKYSHVALVASFDNPNDSNTSSISDYMPEILDFTFSSASGRTYWSTFLSSSKFDSSLNATILAPLQQPTADTGLPVDGYLVAPTNDTTIPPQLLGGNVKPGVNLVSASVQYCLAAVTEPHCTIAFGQGLMLAVVLSMLVKLGLVLFTVCYLRFKPIVSVGDAIASFLEDPDETTSGMRLYSHKELTKIFKNIRATNTWIRLWQLEPKRIHRVPPSFSYDVQALEDQIESQQKLNNNLGLLQDHLRLMHRNVWIERNQHWFHAVSPKRWFSTFASWLSLAAIVAGLSSVVASKSGFSVAWDSGLGNANPSFASQVLANQPLVAEACLVNLPQIAISTLYLTLNGLLTTMLASAEVCDYATDAKPLRTSPPRYGRQRSTYWLQLPFRYSIPLAVISTILHWLVSQSVFLVHLAAYDVSGQLRDANLMNTLGYSLKGMILSVACGIVLLLVPIVLGFRKLDSGIPIFGTNTIALSIACHPLKDESASMHEDSIKFGARLDPHDPFYRWVGFSGNPVTPLRSGDRLHVGQCCSTIFMRSAGVPDYQLTDEQCSFEALKRRPDGPLGLDRVTPAFQLDNMEFWNEKLPVRVRDTGMLDTRIFWAG